MSEIGKETEEEREVRLTAAILNTMVFWVETVSQDLAESLSPQERQEALDELNEQEEALAWFLSRTSARVKTALGIPAASQGSPLSPVDAPPAATTLITAEGTVLSVIRKDTKLS